jgi:imidazolonepropionase
MNAPHRLLIGNIGQLITMAGEPHARVGAEMSDLALIRNAAVLIEGQNVIGCGVEDTVYAAATTLGDFDEIDAAGAVVTPGLIDAHTHLVHGGTRQGEFEARALGKTYAEIMDGGGGIYSSVLATRAATLPELVAAAKLHLAEMLAHGTTTCEAKSGYGLDLETELRQLKAVSILNREQPVELIATFMGAHAVPAGTDQGDYVDWLCGVALPEVAASGLARFNDVFCELGVFTQEESEQILLAGKRFGLQPKIHADELNDTGGAALSARIGAISADHLHCASDVGLLAMADAGTIAVLLPGTAVFLGLTVHAPARRMIEAGVAVALGSDFNPGSCYCRSMPLIMSFACTQLGMSPAEALAASTVNAAYASGVGGRVGTIEVGKQADLVLWDADDYRMMPYAMGANLVRTVIKKGSFCVLP